MKTGYITYYESPIGLIEIRGGEAAITALEFVERRAPAYTANAYLEEALRQVDEYFLKTRRVFDLKLSFTGTPFQKSVWERLQAVPYGATASYRDIAAAIGKPAAVRAVGSANGANPVSLVVPCHRVIGADGSLTGYGGGLWRKEWLLKHEGAIPIGEA